MSALPRPARACPAAGPVEASGASAPRPSCPERGAGARCPVGPAAALLPRDGAERAVMLALRYVAAAAETGDAACFDAAFDGAEAAFGPRDGALLVARAAALVRALRREDAESEAGGGDAGSRFLPRFQPRFLPPACRRLSAGEAQVLAALRPRPAGERSVSSAGSAPPSGAVRAALADLAAPVRSASLGLPVPPLPPLPPLPSLPSLPSLMPPAALAAGGTV